MTRFNMTARTTRLAAIAACALIAPAVAPCAPPEHAAQEKHATDTALAAAATAAAAGSMIGSFEGKAVKDKQHGTLIKNSGDEAGWGWSATSDQRMGGHSTVTITLVHPGARGTHGALHVTGELKSGFVAPWAGAVWFPGSKPMQPTDLSGRKELSFWTRGKPGSYTIMLMAGSPRSMPVYASFDVTNDWTMVTVPLQRSLPGANLHKVYFVAFTGANWGTFQFDLDGVQLH